MKQNKISVWGSFEPIEVSEEIDWAMNPLNDETLVFLLQWFKLVIFSPMGNWTIMNKNQI